MLSSLIEKMWISARKKNGNNILKLIKRDPEANLLDIGCNDGVWTMTIAKKIGTKNVSGIDVVPERLKLAEAKGIKTKFGDVNKRFPFQDNTFDVIHANQLIEHLVDTDHFLSEVYRILKPKGYVIISTENISAWDNIFALTLGFQAFSQHISNKWHIGNKLSPHYGKKIELSSWSHKIIFSYFGLKDILRKYGFKKLKILGSGHFPLPLFFDYLDPIHSHFITI